MSTITGNSAVDGAGIYVINSVANPTITNNTISMNTASRNGGGFHSLRPFDLTLNGNVFYKNGALRGGAIYFNLTTSATVENNTIAENSASIDGSGIFYQDSPITVHKAIIAFNTGSVGVGCSGTDPTTTCSVLWMNNGGSAGDVVCGNTTNNRTADPLFCGGPGSYIYTIEVTSPANVDSSPLCSELIGARPVDCASVPVHPHDLGKSQVEVSSTSSPGIGGRWDGGIIAAEMGVRGRRSRPTGTPGSGRQGS